MKKANGASLVDYVLPTALIGLVLATGLYSILDGNKILGYLSGSGNMEANLPSKVIIVGKSGQSIPDTPGSLGGKNDAPVKKCLNGFCTIDYGDFILRGIPEDLGEYAHSNAASGGNKIIGRLIDQIADQLEKNGDLAGAAEYRNLANLGHYMADCQNKIELTALDFKNSNNTDLSAYRDELINVAEGLTIPQNLTGLLERTPGFGRLVYTFDLGYAKNIKNTDPVYFNQSKKVDPSMTFVDIYENIMNNPKYSDNLKKITQELYLSASDINRSILTDNDIYDPLTGENLGKTTEVIDPRDPFYDRILHPDASKFNDINSALICITGKNLDDSKACHSRK